MPLYATRFGCFSDAGDEFVVEDLDTPTPWINVISNGEWGLTLSAAGGGYSWYRNSNLSRITRWEQDLVRDSSGKWLYIHEPSSGRTWSPALQPAGRGAARRCVHGIGYSRLEGEQDGIGCELTVTVPPDEAGELWLVRLRSTRRAPATLFLGSYLEWQLGPEPEGNREFHKIFIESERHGDDTIEAGKRLFPIPGALEPWNTDYPYRPFFACSLPFAACTDSKLRFIGRHGSFADPPFLRGEPSCELGRWGDGVCATRVALELPAGGTCEVIYALGVSPGLRRYLGVGGEAILTAVRDDWRAQLEASRVKTPEPHFDLLANHWLKYQAISCRMNGRAAYYQSSGASGFRDQLQDSMLFLHLDPERTRQRILEHAEHQHLDGTVLHWWHNLNHLGPRSRFSDDLLWLPFVVGQYVLETDDIAVLDERVAYLDAGEESLDEHCRRAVDRALERRSPRGLPLIGEGDWNDGLSSCGDEGRGESIWVAHFLCRVLADYADLLARRGASAAADSYREARAGLCAAVNEHGWDGAWYWRATLDDGDTIGSARCQEGRIFLNAQTWSIIAGTAPAERRPAVIAAIKEHLDREHGPLLLHPAYTSPDPRIGYLTRYAPGLRENGGVYTHAACWAIMTAALVDDAEWAYALYRKLCPPLRGLDPEAYAGEPYVTPANTDGPESPRFGRGGWTWYTGSAAWLYRVMTEWILGIRPAREGLLVRPCIPGDWPGFEARRLFRGRVYDIEVGRGAPALVVNGRELAPGAPILGDREVNKVKVRLP